MLKPNLTRELGTSSPTTVLAAGDKIVWNPLTPVEDLPQALKQLREAQQRINRLVQDAEAQVVHFLRYGPFSNCRKHVKRSIELFYNFSETALRENVGRLDPLVVDENVYWATQNIDCSFWKGFSVSWEYISSGRPVPIFALEKNASEWKWPDLAANPLMDWTPKTIKRHFRQLASSFTALSANTGLNWTPELLRAFALHWDYSTNGLLGNESLPWEDKSLPGLLMEIAPDDADLGEDDLQEKADEMQERLWERLSLNRHRLWTVEELRQHREELDWSRLSANPGLPFSVGLLIEFERQWDWDRLPDNPGFYEKVLRPLLSDTAVREFLVLSQL